MIIYAQTNYPIIQGIRGRYTIAQIGCFITAFCNLQASFGRPIDPPALNAFLRDQNIYTDVDDGIDDDVGWGTITQYDRNTIVIDIGPGIPPSDNAIVKFVYNSYQTGNLITHFCFVHDHNAGTVIDSWDGQVKSWNVYGGPKAWATYENNNQPQGGNNMTRAEAEEIVDGLIYRGFLNRPGDEGGIKNYADKLMNGQYEFIGKDVSGSDEFRALHEKTVEKVVERVVEKPVEVIKEVPAPGQADPDGDKWRNLKKLQKELLV